MPISALRGDNVVERSDALAWYEAPPLLEQLETVEIDRDRNLDDVRFPVQWTVRADDYRGYAGRVAGGVLATGDEVVVLPSGARSRIAAIDTPGGPVERVGPPAVATVRLSDELDVGRGDVLVGPGGDARGRARARGHRVLDGRDAGPRRRALPAQAHDAPRARQHRLDRRAGRHLHLRGVRRPTRSGLNDIGRITLRTAAPVLADPYAANRATGAFILIDERTHDTVAAGMVEAARGPRARRRALAGHPLATERARPLRALGADRAARRDAVADRACRPPASRRSRSRPSASWSASGRFAYLLDGDNLRHGLSGDLGFDPASRSENIRRVAHVARLFADAGAVAVVSLVSPFREDRLAARQLHEAAGLEFIEVFVDTPIEECARRDPKGLYARARAGRLTGMTGENAPYEPPEAAEIVIRDELTEVSAARLVAAIS